MSKTMRQFIWDEQDRLEGALYAWRELLTRRGVFKAASPERAEARNRHAAEEVSLGKALEARHLGGVKVSPVVVVS